MPALPTGVVTFLLTDVVGSTELWERAPARMTTALVRHDAIVATAVDGEGGVLLKTKGEGDSTFSVFARASDAVRAAYRLQRTMRAERWPGAAPMSVRVAVHTGEAVERDGDYFGPAVNRVARLRGVAAGGQVILSAATVSIVRRDLPRGCDLVDLGPIELRGIAEPEVAWALTAPDLAPIERDRATRPDDRGVSRREAEVHALVRENLTNAEIAGRLFISERTVESHVSSLLRKLGAADRRELARHAAGGTETAAPSRLPPMLELLADRSTFSGRASEREALRVQWQRACAGRTLLAVVTGEAGIGKSRLVSELAAEVHADGGRVLYGACYEDVDQPYGPFADAIATEVGDLTELAVEERLGSDRDALGRLSPELARLVGHPGGDAGVAERGLVLDAIERWLVAGGLPTLVVVEDLHWATSSTREMLRHLVRRAGRQPLLVVATSRDTAPDLDAELRSLLADLERSPAVTTVVLHGLGVDDVASLLDVSAVEAGPIVDDTDGNPLLVTSLATDGRTGSLAALLDSRDRLLDDEARSVLDLAATFGSDFDAELVAAGHGAPLLAVLDALEQGEAAGLLVPLPGRPGRFGFVHALFRAHRYHRFPVRRRLELHASAATALATRAGDERLLSERARHACLAVPIGDAGVAVELAIDAGEAAEHAYAFDEAASHYQRGLDAAGSLDPPDRHVVLDLDVRRAAALYQSNHPDALTMLIEAGDRARREQDGDALVKAATSFTRFGASGNFGGPVPEQLALVEDALAMLGPVRTATRARLLIAMTGQIGETNVEESISLAEEAAAIARDVGDLDALADVLLTARLIGNHPGRHQDFSRIASELESVGRRYGSIVLTLAGAATRASGYLELGQLSEWEATSEHLERLAGTTSVALLQLNVVAKRIQRALLDGELAHAAELAAQVDRLAVDHGFPRTAWSGLTVVNIARIQARDAELLPLDIARVTGSFIVVRYIRAAAHARAGDNADARDDLAALRADGYPMPHTFPWSQAMSELAEAAEVAGDPDAAAHVIAECAAYSGRIAVPGPSICRSFDQMLAQAALAIGDAELAERYAAQAVTASREWRTDLFLCRDLVFLAEARRRLGAAPDSLRPLVAEARTIAASIGARIVDVDIERYGLPS